MPVVVIGLSHHTSPVEQREQFAFSEADADDALVRLRSSGLASEGVILSTCNRVELYAAVSRPETVAMEALTKFVAEHRGQPIPTGTAFYRLSEPESIEHL